MAFGGTRRAPASGEMKCPSDGIGSSSGPAGGTQINHKHREPELENEQSRITFSLWFAYLELPALRLGIKRDGTRDLVICPVALKECCEGHLLPQTQVFARADALPHVHRDLDHHSRVRLIDRRFDVKPRFAQRLQEFRIF